MRTSHSPTQHEYSSAYVVIIFDFRGQDTRDFSSLDYWWENVSSVFLFTKLAYEIIHSGRFALFNDQLTMH